MKSMMTAALAALLALGAVGVATADEAKKADQPAAKAGGMDQARLKETLDLMGYPFKEVKSTDGTPMYLVTLERDNYRYVFYVALSSDGTNLWLFSGLGELPPADQVPAGQLEKLLAESNARDPNHFVLKGRRIYMTRHLDNHDLKPAQLRTAIDAFCGDIRATEALWSPEKWEKAAKADAKK
jgi:hypothetical protein